MYYCYRVLCIPRYTSTGIELDGYSHFRETTLYRIKTSVSNVGAAIVVMVQVLAVILVQT